jgi:hypothetical protein
VVTTAFTWDEIEKRLGLFRGEKKKKKKKSREVPSSGETV